MSKKKSLPVEEHRDRLRALQGCVDFGSSDEDQLALLRGDSYPRLLEDVLARCGPNAPRP